MRYYDREIALAKAKEDKLPWHEMQDLEQKYSDQLSTTALVRRNTTKNLENSCFILNQLYLLRSAP